MKRRTGSGLPIPVTTDINAELVEKLICSQEEFSGTHESSNEIARNVGINKSSVRSLVKKISQFQTIKSPPMNKWNERPKNTKVREFSWAFR